VDTQRVRSANRSLPKPRISRPCTITIRCELVHSYVSYNCCASSRMKNKSGTVAYIDCCHLTRVSSPYAHATRAGASKG
jgi:hypothetical protein